MISSAYGAAVAFIPDTPSVGINTSGSSAVTLTGIASLIHHVAIHAATARHLRPGSDRTALPASAAACPPDSPPKAELAAGPRSRYTRAATHGPATNPAHCTNSMAEDLLVAGSPSIASVQPTPPGRQGSVSPLVM